MWMIIGKRLYEKQKAGGYLATASRLQGIFTLKTTNPNLNK